MFTLTFEKDHRDFLSQAENLFGQNRLPEALILAEKHRLCNPLDVDAHVLVGNILIRMGELDQARDILMQVDQTISELSFVYARMADIFSEKGLKNDAAICYRKFIHFNPISQQAAEIAEKLSSFEKQESDATGIENSGIEDIHKPQFFTITLAELYIKQGHLQMAKEVLAEIVKREPGNIVAAAKLDSVKAVMSKDETGSAEPADHDNLVDTLSGWLANIDRLNTHATGK
jgi:tetratricopeptide (TPR) repeat protein